MGNFIVSKLFAIICVYSYIVKLQSGWKYLMIQIFNWFQNQLLIAMPTLPLLNPNEERVEIFLTELMKINSCTGNEGMIIFSRI